jgi:transcriptional regulator with XRE-family HTH domain
MKPGRIIKLLRESRELVLIELAARVDIDSDYLEQMENDQVEAPLKLYERIADYFKIPITLLRESEDEEMEREIFSKLRKVLVSVLEAKLVTRLKAYEAE